MEQSCPLGSSSLLSDCSPPPTGMTTMSLWTRALPWPPPEISTDLVAMVTGMAEVTTCCWLTTEALAMEEGWEWVQGQALMTTPHMELLRCDRT